MTGGAYPCKKCGMSRLNSIHNNLNRFEHHEFVEPPEEKDPEPAYHIEVDINGCDKCGSGRCWLIIGPDGYGGGQSYGEEEEADHICEMLNDAFDRGVAAGRAQ